MALIHEQIPKIMGSVGAIGKDRNNPQQGYKFRGIDDVYNALNATMAEHGVFTVPEILELTREERATKAGGLLIYTMLKMKYTFFASDGSSLECVVIGEGMDSGDKSANKAMSAAQKYAYLQVFSIPTEEPKDSENASPEPAHRPAPQPTQSSQPAPQPPQPSPPGEEKLMSDAQKRKLWAMMKEAGLTSDEGKDLFAFAQVTTSKQASQLIEHLNTVIADWRMATGASSQSNHPQDDEDIGF